MYKDLRIMMTKDLNTTEEATLATHDPIGKQEQDKRC